MESNSRKARKEAGGPHEVTRRDRKARTTEVLEIKDELLYRKGILWILEDGGIIKTILESEHDSKIAGHMGQDKTIELVRRHFWWPKMDEHIIDYIRSYPECQRNRAAQQHPYGLSLSLELPYALWQSIAMDFITELPELEECDQLWVV